MFVVKKLHSNYHFELKGVQGVLVNVIVTKEDKDTLLKQLFHIILHLPIVHIFQNHLQIQQIINPDSITCGRSKAFPDRFR